VIRHAPILAALFVLVAGGADASPRVDYIVHCQGCHLADGSATPGRIPALDGSMGRFLRVPGGREFLVRVPGTAQAPLSDGEIAELLNWMLVEFSREELPDRFERYTAEEVRQYRSEPLSKVEAERRRLLDALERER
jgi:mono/diheme cytochrome c family protein